jgi:hypothetical protein
MSPLLHAGYRGGKESEYIESTVQIIFTIIVAIVSVVCIVIDIRRHGLFNDKERR